MDGSTPTETNGALYSGPITIASPTTLQAIAYGNGSGDSPVSIVNISVPTITITTPVDGSTITGP
jgi:hypothetical protein